MDNRNDLSQPANHEGLAKELLTVVHDPKFQKTTDKFVRKNDVIFKVLKGVGFAIAMASGLFGYLLKANSEADDRKAEALTRVINEKKEWARRASDAIIELRSIRSQIKVDCDFGKPVSAYQQRKLRSAASFKLLGALSGIDEVFDEGVKDALAGLVRFDESITDVCAENAPSGTAWRAHLAEINQLMRASIQKDREALDKLATGLLSNFFRKI
jgi:hypothetical protein